MQVTYENRTTSFDEEYIDLAMITIEKKANKYYDNEVFQKANDGRVDEILKSKMVTPLKVDDLVRDSRYILVEGPPGTGKSTLCWELCRRWDTLESLQDFKIILHLLLRDKEVQEAKSLEDIIKHQDEQLKKDIIAAVNKEEGRGVLFILDGLDELPISTILDKSSFIMNLIDFVCLKFAKRLVTTRPMFYNFNFPRSSKRVKILGFSEDSKMKYAEFALPPRIIQYFKDFIDSNPIFSMLMCIPVNCAFITQVFPKNITSVRTLMSHKMASLYITMLLVNRHMRELDKNSVVPDRNYEVLTDDIIATLESVSASFL